MGTHDDDRVAPAARRVVSALRAVLARIRGHLLRAYAGRGVRRRAPGASRAADRRSSSDAASSPAAAATEARRQLGGIAQLTEERRTARGFAVIDETWQDLRYALRVLRKRPQFTLAAVLVLTIGLGSVAAIFAVVDALVLRPLPYPAPDQLVRSTAIDPNGGTWPLSQPDLIDFRQRARSLSLVGWQPRSMNVSRNEGPTQIEGAAVSASFFPTLGRGVLLGRVFSDDDERAGGSRAVVVTRAFWERELRGDRDAVGRPLVIDGETWTVVGVLASRVDLLPTVDLYVPLHVDPSYPRTGREIEVFGRLRTGVSIGAAEAEIVAKAGELAREYPASHHGWSARLTPFRDVDRRPAAHAHGVGALRRRRARSACSPAPTSHACCSPRAAAACRSSQCGAPSARRPDASSGSSSQKASAWPRSAPPLAGFWRQRSSMRCGPGLRPSCPSSQTSISTPRPWDVLQSPRSSRACWRDSRLPGSPDAPIISRVCCAPAARFSTPQAGRRALVVAQIALATLLAVGATLLGASFLRLRSVDVGFDPDRALAIRLMFPARAVQCRAPRRAPSGDRRSRQRAARRAGRGRDQRHTVPGLRHGQPVQGRGALAQTASMPRHHGGRSRPASSPPSACH